MTPSARVQSHTKKLKRLREALAPGLAQARIGEFAEYEVNASLIAELDSVNYRVEG